MPAHIIYFTDGSDKRVQVGGQTIEFRHASTKRMAGAGKISGLVIQALRYFGKGNVGSDMVQRLQSTFTDEERKVLRQDISIAPDWLRPIIVQITDVGTPAIYAKARQKGRSFMNAQYRNRSPLLLERMASTLRESNPDNQWISYKFETWQHCFQQDADLIDIDRRLGGKISRSNVVDFGKEAKIDSACVRRFAMAVMIWGYGTVGYGATRTSRMLAHTEAVARLTRGAELVRAGDLEDACLYFRDSDRGYLNQFGWSFFTKYFYFVGLAAGISPMPLILDGNKPESGVAGGMKMLADAGDPGAAQSMKLWWSSVDRLSAEGYALYVDLVNRWANDLGCRSDAIEMALWKGLDLEPLKEQ